jgi:hypothetical protein
MNVPIAPAKPNMPKCVLTISRRPARCSGSGSAQSTCGRRIVRVSSSSQPGGEGSILIDAAAGVSHSGQFAEAGRPASV